MTKQEYRAIVDNVNSKFAAMRKRIESPVPMPRSGAFAIKELESLKPLQQANAIRAIQKRLGHKIDAETCEFIYDLWKFVR